MPRFPQPGRAPSFWPARFLSPWHGWSVHAQSAENVAVVINDNSPDSQRIGEHYARTRALPAEQRIRIRASTDETVDRAGYASTIEAPIAAAIRRAGGHDRVLYLVLTKGVPLRISGTTGLEGTLSSVDSELTLLYRRMTGQAVPPAGKIDNPYFLGARELRTALPFSHREHDIYLVTRIDAFTVDQAMSLVDKAQKPGTDGRIVLDQRDEDADAPGKSVDRAGGADGSTIRVTVSAPLSKPPPNRRATSAGCLATILRAQQIRTIGSARCGWVSCRDRSPRLSPARMRGRSCRRRTAGFPPHRTTLRHFLQGRRTRSSAISFATASPAWRDRLASRTCWERSARIFCFRPISPASTLPKRSTLRRRP